MGKEASVNYELMRVITEIYHRILVRLLDRSSDFADTVNMKTKHTLPWHDTPAKSERIVSAITRISSVLRSGAWQFATTEGLNPTQVDILEALRSRGGGVRLSWIAQHLGVTAASASDSITSLTTKGLIEKGLTLLTDALWH